MLLVTLYIIIYYIHYRELFVISSVNFNCQPSTLAAELELVLVHISNTDYPMR